MELDIVDNTLLASQRNTDNRLTMDDPGEAKASPWQEIYNEEEIPFFTRYAHLVPTVGCIYASKPFNSSLIYYQHLFPLQFYYQTPKTTEIYFFYFSCIFTDIVFVSFVFFMLLVIWRFVSFASAATFDSRSRKRLLTHWLYLMISPPDGQGAKVPGKQVYASETH